MTFTISRGLLILYRLPPTGAWVPQEGGGHWTLLSFLSPDDHDRALDLYAAQPMVLDGVIRAGPRLQDAAMRAREKYTAFIAQWPERVRLGGRTFKERFTDRGELAYWWLTIASMKQNELSPTFTYLTHLEVVQEALQGVAACLCVGAEAAMALLIHQACIVSGITLLAVSTAPRHRNGTALRGLLARLLFLGKLLVRLVAFRILFRPPRAEGPLVGFYTLYPEMLRVQGAELMDRNYRTLPALVQRAGRAVAMLAAFVPLSWRGWLTLLRERGALARSRVVWLDRYLRGADILAAAGNLAFFVQYLWLERTQCSFRNSFAYDALDLRPIVGPEFAQAFLSNQLPYHLVHARLVERVVRELPLTHVVCFLELYPTARAVYAGARRSARPVATVAFQHANISRMKLWYSYRPEEVAVPGRPGIETMPLPDLYLFQGAAGMRIIQESGYPRARCRLTGSPRYDALTPFTDQLHRVAPGGAGEAAQPVVLVVPSLSDVDALDLVQASAAACRDLDPAPRILVRLHPASRVGPRLGHLARQEGVDLQAVDGDLYQALASADVIVTSYSTVGDEAVALGRPVICYTDLRPSLSSFVDVPAAPLVHDARELREALRRMLWDPEYRAMYARHRPALIEASFYRLDGEGGRRMAEALLEA